MNYDAQSLTPGQESDRFTIESQLWFGRDDQQKLEGGVILSSTVDAGHTSQTTQLRPGLILGRIAATGKLTTWNPYAVDGSQIIAGFYLNAQMMERLGTAVDRFVPNIFYAGNVRPQNILIPGETAYGISGHAFEFLIRDQLKQRFVFQDDIYGNYFAPKEMTILTDYTATVEDNNTTFVLSAAAAAARTVTLPAPRPGLVFHAVNAHTTPGTTLTLEGPATGEYWVGGAVANSIVIAGDTSIIQTVRGMRTNATGPVYSYVRSSPAFTEN